jgi:hypothetical protein
MVIFLRDYGGVLPRRHTRISSTMSKLKKLSVGCRDKRPTQHASFLITILIDLICVLVY